MTLHVDLRPALRAFEREVGGDFVRSQIPFAMALALTQTAKGVKDDERAEMQRAFDRPRPYTLNSQRVVPARKASLVAEVRIKDGGGGRSAATYLQPQATGGDRVRKAFETTIMMAANLTDGRSLAPARVVGRDSAGNIARGRIGATVRGLARKGKGTHARGYFGARPGNAAGLAAGIYQRIGKGKVKAIFTARQTASYRPRFDYVKLGAGFAARRFPDALVAALAQAIRTGRPR